MKHAVKPALSAATKFFYIFFTFFKLPTDNALKMYPVIFLRTKQEQLTKS